MSKELGTLGSIIGSKASFKGIFDRSALKRLIESFVRDYVICPECNSPDTYIFKEKRLRFLKCEACGARSPIKDI